MSAKKKVRTTELRKKIIVRRESKYQKSNKVKKW
jgi:hypothetical protein